MKKLFLILFFTSSVFANDPVYDNEGSPPSGLPAIESGSTFLTISMSQGNDFTSGERPQHNGGLIELKTFPLDVVNGGVDSFDTRKIMQNWAQYWNIIDSRMTEAGKENTDVQVIWMLHATRANSGIRQVEIDTLQLHLEQIMDEAERRYPNLRAGFISSRMYGGFCGLNPEPFAWDTIFAVEGALEDETIWHLGPYTWADGSNPRADGLVWLRSDFVPDGCHPSTQGIGKGVDMLNRFFNQLDYSGEPPPPPPVDGAMNLSVSGAGPVFSFDWQNEGSELICGGNVFPVSGESASLTIPDDLPFGQRHSCRVDQSNQTNDFGCLNASTCRIF